MRNETRAEHSYISLHGGIKHSSMHAREHSREQQQRASALQQPLSTGKSALLMLVASLYIVAMLTAAGVLYVVHNGASGLLEPTVHVSRCGLSAHTQLQPSHLS